MNEITDKSWETWAAAALGGSVSNISAECVDIEEHIHLFPNGRDKAMIADLVLEIENRATWIKQLAHRQMLEDMKRKM